jgi:hypothetical protein
MNVKIETSRAVIVPAVLYNYEAWSLTLSGQRGVFENRMLRRISEPKRSE